MKRLAGIGFALLIVGSMASAQLIEGPRRNPPRPPSVPPANPSGNFGVGISIDFSRQAPVAPPLELRDADVPDQVADQVIFMITGSEAEAERIAGQARVNLIEFARLEAIDKAMVVASLPPGDTVDAAMARLGSIKGALWAQPNFQFQPLGAAVPRRFRLMGISRPAQMRVSGTIAIIDTPIETGNPALAGATVSQTVFGTSASPAMHGTAIASLLVGSGEVNGIAQGARLVSLAAFDPGSAASGVSQTRYIAKALDAAWRLRPDVLNLSFGGREDRVLSELIASIDRRGICIAAAAGNGGPNSAVLFPARHPAVLAVTAVDERLRGYAHAARGPEIDVSGVGVGLLANVPGGYRQVSGTSFATAIVSGALLRLPQCTTARDPAAMRAQVAARARDLGAHGPDPVFGAGLLWLGGAGRK